MNMYDPKISLTLISGTLLVRSLLQVLGPEKNGSLNEKEATFPRDDG